MKIINSCLLFLIILFFSRCINSENNTECKKFTDNLILDSLKKEKYQFAKDIDFFTLNAKDTIYPTTEDKNFYAVKRKANDIDIIIINNGKISLKRKIKKFTSAFYKEERIIDSSDGGEINYLTYYYSKDRIVITEVTKSIFEDNNINCYLAELHVIENKIVTEYSYKYNNEFHLTKEFLLNKSQLQNINEEALSLFYNKENVNIYNFPLSEFTKEKTYLWEMNQLIAN